MALKNPVMRPVAAEECRGEGGRRDEEGHVEERRKMTFGFIGEDRLDS
jgi:hypothetical protein